MPNIITPLSNIDQSVARPSIMDIIAQVMKITNIAPGTQIFFSGDMQKMQAGANINNQSSRQAILSAVDGIFIEVDENFDKDPLLSTMTTQDEHISVFRDDSIGFVVAPVYATVSVVINIRYRTKSKTQAANWMKDMRMKVSQMRDLNLHRITYHYTLPKSFHELLTHIHSLLQLESKPTLKQYVMQHASERLKLVSDLAGNCVELAIAETQCEIQGIYDFDGIPDKPQRDDESGTFEISFPYKFSYEQPIGINMRYPIIVHNSLLDPRFVDSLASQKDDNTTVKSFSRSLAAFYAFRSQTAINHLYTPLNEARIPSYDDYAYPPSSTQGLSPYLSLLLTIDPSNPYVLFNLRDLGDWCISESILDFFEKIEYPYLGQMLKSIFSFELYENKTRKTNALRVDENLNVVSKIEPSIKNQYRVRLSIVADLMALDRNALLRLPSHPEAFTDIFEALCPLIAKNPQFRKHLLGNGVSLWMFTKIFSIMTGNIFSTNQTPYASYEDLELFETMPAWLIEQYIKKARRTKTLMLTKTIITKK